MPDTEISNQIALSIGGSGARCAEALVYLCAAGLGPDSLTFAFVDADTTNDSLRKVVDLAKLYGRLQPHSADEAKASPFLKTKITIGDPAVWTPFGDGAAKPTLERYFDYSGLSGNKNPQLANCAHLMEALYSREQRSASLEVGFRGKPSIGAAIFSDSVNRIDEPWQQISTSIQTAVGGKATVRVFAMGSVFGGTGAAGLPSIPRLLRDSVKQGQENVHLGALLLLPYFTFSPPGTLDEVYASPDLFVMNSKESLRYYHSLSAIFHRIYILGTPAPAPQAVFGLGGPEQKNLPHFIEMIGALGAIDFFHDSEARTPIALLGVENAAGFTWGDVPDQGSVQPKLGNLARMLFFYLNTIHPRLLEIQKGAASKERTPWYQHLLVRRDMALEDSGTWQFFDDLRDFATRFLCWLRDVQHNSGEIAVALANSNSFPNPENGPAGLMPANFDGDIVRQGKGAAFSIEGLWARLCEQESIRKRKLGGKRAFQTALYEASKSARS